MDTTHKPPASSVAVPSPEALVATARRIAPTLVGRQAETEQRTYYAADTHEEFMRAGFYRILVPRRYGGYELGMEPFIGVVKEIARGCGSTAWQLALGAQHAAIVASFFPEQTQAAVFADSDFISPGTTAPTGKIERNADGGWTVNGTWAFCSGAPYSTHSVAHAMLDDGTDEPPTPTMFVIPRDQYTILDDWGTQLGLKGSGSHSIRISDGRIPESFALPGTTMLTAPTADGTPGSALHGNPFYCSPPAGLLALQFAAIAVGMAQSALDTYRDIARTKPALKNPEQRRSETPECQRWYGAATGIIATADAALQRVVADWTELGNQRQLAREDWRFIMMICAIRDMCWDAVDQHLFRTAGSTAVRAGERMERIWRDMSTQHSHTGVVILRETAELQLGVTELTGLPHHPNA